MSNIYSTLRAGGDITGSNEANLYHYFSGSVSLPATSGGNNSGIAIKIYEAPAFYPSAIHLDNVTGVTVDFSISPDANILNDINNNMVNAAALWKSQVIPANGIVPINYKIKAFRVLNSSGSPVQVEWVS